MKNLCLDPDTVSGHKSSGIWAAPTCKMEMLPQTVREDGRLPSVGKGKRQSIIACYAPHGLRFSFSFFFLGTLYRRGLGVLCSVFFFYCFGICYIFMSAAVQRAARLARTLPEDRGISKASDAGKRELVSALSFCCRSQPFVL